MLIWERTFNVRREHSFGVGWCLIRECSGPSFYLKGKLSATQHATLVLQTNKPCCDGIKRWNLSFKKSGNIYFFFFLSSTFTSQQASSRLSKMDELWRLFIRRSRDLLNVTSLSVGLMTSQRLIRFDNRSFSSSEKFDIKSLRISQLKKKLISCNSIKGVPKCDYFIIIRKLCSVWH